MDEKVGEKGISPLEWGKAKVRIELAHQGLVHQLESGGSFFRLGSDPRCEWCIPTLPGPVVAYIQVGPGYLSVLELVDSPEAGPSEPICLLPGGTVWLQPNARITLTALAQYPAEPETFSWETFHAEDIKVFPNTLVVRSGLMGTGGASNHFRLQSSLSLLGTSPGCHVQLSHRNLSKFQAVIFRGELQGQPMRVVDLFGSSVTLLNGKAANGEVIEVGQELQIGGVRFEAVRFLYHASRPDHLIQVGHSFPTLPLPPQRPATKPPVGGVEMRSGKVGSEKKLPQPQKDSGPAIGFDLPSKSKNSIHFDLRPVGERVVAPIPSVPTSSVQGNGGGTAKTVPTQPPPPPPPAPAPPSAVAVAPIVNVQGQGASKADLEEVQKKSIEALRGLQKDLSEQIKSLTTRLDGIEEAIEYFPMAIQENTDQLMQAMGRLCESVSSLSRPQVSDLPVKDLVASESLQQIEPIIEKPRPVELKPVKQNVSEQVLHANATSGVTSESTAAKKPVDAKDLVAAKDSKAAKDSSPNKGSIAAKGVVAASDSSKSNIKQPEVKRPHTTQASKPKVVEGGQQKQPAGPMEVAEPALSVTGPLTLAVQKAEAEAAEKKSLFSKWKDWLKQSRAATPLPENEEIQRPVNPPTKRKAEKDFVGESVLVNSGNTTARRTRLQADPNSAEILASHESEDETLVLGSLMGLRYRDARSALLRWAALFGLFFVVAVVGGPLAWYRIPEGWRELIWQKITFAPPEGSESMPGEVGKQSRSAVTPGVETVEGGAGQAGVVPAVEAGSDSPKSSTEESGLTPEVVPEALPKLEPENEPVPVPTAEPTSVIEPTGVIEPSSSTKDEPSVVEPVAPSDPKPATTPGVNPPSKP